MIIDKNGMATLNFEHAWGDGVAVLRLMEETFKDTNLNHFVGPGQEPAAGVDTAALVRPIGTALLGSDLVFRKKILELRLTFLFVAEFELTDSLRGAIVKAREKHTASCSGLEFDTVEYFDLNRQSIKQHRLSPDSLMQLAIQVKLCSELFIPNF